MEIYWECEYDKSSTRLLFQSAKSKFEKCLIEFDVNCLDEIYVVDEDKYEQKCKEVFKSYYGIIRNGTVSETTMAECFEKYEPEYSQTLVIKCDIFIYFLCDLVDENFSNDEKIKLLSKQLIYHEFSHLYEMNIRNQKGLTVNRFLRDKYEASKILWSEYYAERKSCEKFSDKQLKILNLEKKFEGFYNFEGHVELSSFMYHLIHLLAINNTWEENEIKEYWNRSNYSFLIPLIIQVNNAMKMIYDKFPEISEDDIAKIFVIFDIMLNEVKKHL